MKEAIKLVKGILEFENMTCSSEDLETLAVSSVFDKDRRGLINSLLDTLADKEKAKVLAHFTRLNGSAEEYFSQRMMAYKTYRRRAVISANRIKDFGIEIHVPKDYKERVQYSSRAVSEVYAPRIIIEAFNSEEAIVFPEKTKEFIDKLFLNRDEKIQSGRQINFNENSELTNAANFFEALGFLRYEFDKQKKGDVYLCSFKHQTGYQNSLYKIGIFRNLEEETTFLESLYEIVKK